MSVLSLADLFPGRPVWLEYYGEAFKQFLLVPVRVVCMTPVCVLLEGASMTFRLSPTFYDREMVWRCWDRRPSSDTLSETPWSDDPQTPPSAPRPQRAA